MWEWAKIHPRLFTLMVLGLFGMGASVLCALIVDMGLLCGVQANW